jgi:putative transcriptional regulator
MGLVMTKEEIKALRMRLGLTQWKLAVLLGVTELTIIRWEGGKYRPSALAMEKIKQLIQSEARV